MDVKLPLTNYLCVRAAGRVCTAMRTHETRSAHSSVNLGHDTPTSLSTIMSPRFQSTLTSFALKTVTTLCAMFRVPTNLENLENLELSGNFVNLEKSGNLRCGQGIFCEMSHFLRVAYL